MKDFNLNTFEKCFTHCSCDDEKILKETYDIAKENIENIFFELSGIKKEFKNINNIDTFDTY